MKLTREARQGLIDSIAAWEGKKKAKNPHAVGISSIHCPLCAIFLYRTSLMSPQYLWQDRYGHHERSDHGQPYRCFGCPISHTTGKELCEGSPWRKAKQRLVVWQNYPYLTPPRAAFRRACTKMIRFMQKILEDAE